jgi:hypothetical protein
VIVYQLLVVMVPNSFLKHVIRQMHKIQMHHHVLMRVQFLFAVMDLYGVMRSVIQENGVMTL